MKWRHFEGRPAEIWCGAAQSGKNCITHKLLRSAQRRLQVGHKEVRDENQNSHRQTEGITTTETRVQSQLGNTRENIERNLRSQNEFWGFLVREFGSCCVWSSGELALTFIVHFFHWMYNGCS